MIGLETLSAYKQPKAKNFLGFFSEILNLFFSSDNKSKADTESDQSKSLSLS